MVGFAADEVKHQRGDGRPGEYANDDAPRGNACPQDNGTTDKDCQRGYFTNGTGNVADKGIPPAPVCTHRIHAARRGFAQCGRAGITINGNPNFVAGNLRRIGKIKESACGKGGVHKITSGATKNFLAQHHTKADANSDLPQRNRWRQGQGEKDGGDEEAFAYFMLAHNTEKDFPSDTNREGNDIDGQVQFRAKPEIGNQAGIGDSLRFRRLHADEIPARKHCRENSHPDQNHYPL